MLTGRITIWLQDEKDGVSHCKTIEGTYDEPYEGFFHELFNNSKIGQEIYMEGGTLIVTSFSKSQHKID